MQDPILITGIPRSGTSMVAGCFHKCGAFGGNMAGPNRNNEKGMFENIRVRGVVKEYLRQIGVDPLGQYPLPNPAKLGIPTNWRRIVENIMKDEGYDGGAWMYKGAKITLTYPVWQYAFPNAKYIIVRRRTPQIITSCKKTGFMKAFHNEKNQRAVGAANEDEGWLWWIHQHEKRFVEMIQAGLNAKIVWAERMIWGDYQQMREAIEWAGLDWHTHAQEVYNFVEPKLWKAKQALK